MNMQQQVSEIFIHIQVHFKLKLRLNIKTAVNRCQWSQRQQGKVKPSPCHPSNPPSHAPHES